MVNRFTHWLRIRFNHRLRIMLPRLSNRRWAVRALRVIEMTPKITHWDRLLRHPELPTPVTGAADSHVAYEMLPLHTPRSSVAPSLALLSSVTLRRYRCYPTASFNTQALAELRCRSPGLI